MSDRGVEDWLQTVAAAFLAAFLPLVPGWTVREFGPAVLRAFSPAAPMEQFETLTGFIAPLVVLVCSPFVVFLLARWAARVADGFPMIRATLVGLAPAVLMGWVIAVRAPSALFTGAPPFTPSAMLVWTALNLAAGVLAGLLTRRGGPG